MQYLFQNRKVPEDKIVSVFLEYYVHLYFWTHGKMNLMLDIRNTVVYHKVLLKMFCIAIIE